MLYPEEDRARQFFEEVDARGFESLPEREGRLRELRAAVLLLFIRCPTPDQRRFLAGLLNTSSNRRNRIAMRFSRMAALPALTRFFA
jgi:hypothetical protein